MRITVTRREIVDCGCWDAYRTKIATGEPIDPDPDDLAFETHMSLVEAEEIGLIPKAHVALCCRVCGTDQWYCRTCFPQGLPATAMKAKGG